MQLLTPIIKKYFDDLTPGQIIKVWETKRPCLLVWSAQEYIEQGGQLEISPDYERIIKLSQ